MHDSRCAFAYNSFGKTRLPPPRQAVNSPMKKRPGKIQAAFVFVCLLQGAGIALLIPSCAPRLRIENCELRIENCANPTGSRFCLKQSKKAEVAKLLPSAFRLPPSSGRKVIANSSRRVVSDSCRPRNPRLRIANCEFKKDASASFLSIAVRILALPSP